MGNYKTKFVKKMNEKAQVQFEKLDNALALIPMWVIFTILGLLFVLTIFSVYFSLSSNTEFENSMSISSRQEIDSLVVSSIQKQDQAKGELDLMSYLVQNNLVDNSGHVNVESFNISSYGLGQDKVDEYVLFSDGLLVYYDDNGNRVELGCF